MELLRVHASQPGMAGGQWKQGLLRLFGELDLTVDEPFAGASLDRHELADASLLDMAAGSQHLVAPAGGSDRGQIVSFVVQLEGTALIEQAGRACELAPGGMTLVDGGAASVFSFPGRYRQLALFMPRAALRTMPPGAVAMRMDVADPVDRLLWENARCLPEIAQGLDARGQEAVLSAVLGLIRASTAFRAAPERGQGRVHVRLERALAYIERHLGDPELTAERVAAAQHVSRRYLDELLAQEGMTLDRLIWERRLTGAAESLAADPRGERTVLTIALEHGFRDASHFSHAFRRRFGKTPSAWRRGVPVVEPRAKPG